MGTKNKLAELLNIGEIESLFKYFTVTTGISVTLFDDNAVVVLANRCESGVCGSFNSCICCKQDIIYGAKKSAELGAPYIYSCACGFVMCSSPVLIDGELLGSIVCGPIILWEADDYAVQELMQKSKGMVNPNISVDDVLSKVKTVECQNMTAAAQLLFISVNSICNNNSVILSERAKIAKQQSQISQLIAERKVLKRDTGMQAYPKELERELISLVRSGNRQQAKKMLNDVLAEIFLWFGGNTNSVKARVFELIAFLGRAASDNGASIVDVDGIIKSSIDILSTDTEFEELCFLTSNALERFIDIIYLSRDTKALSEHLQKAVDYIEANYASDINLSRVAGESFVSVYYLCHMFKDELGTTFSDYLTKLRISHAKEMLKDKSLQIQDITGLVGFNDANYFAKIFKKHTGTSPKEYRAMFI